MAALLKKLLTFTRVTTDDIIDTAAQSSGWESYVEICYRSPSRTRCEARWPCSP